MGELTVHDNVGRDLKCVNPKEYKLKDVLDGMKKIKRAKKEELEKERDALMEQQRRVRDFTGDEDKEHDVFENSTAAGTLNDKMNGFDGNNEKAKKLLGEIEKLKNGLGTSDARKRAGELEKVIKKRMEAEKKRHEENIDIRKKDM